jgi:hypothetical protein
MLHCFPRILGKGQHVVFLHLILSSSLYEGLGRGESGQVLNNTVFVSLFRAIHNIVANLFLLAEVRLSIALTTGLDRGSKALHISKQNDAKYSFYLLMWKCQGKL